MLILIRNAPFFSANCGFAICDLRTRTARKFAELQLFCGLIVTNLRICDFRTGEPLKFADLRLRNESKNLRIFDLRTNKNRCVPTFVNYTTVRNKE
jgi:hypothetical protein